MKKPQAIIGDVVIICNKKSYFQSKIKEAYKYSCQNDWHYVLETPIILEKRVITHCLDKDIYYNFNKLIN